MNSYEEIAEQLICVVNSGVSGKEAVAHTNDGLIVKVAQEPKIKDIYNISISKFFEEEEKFIGKIYGVWEKALPSILKKIDKKTANVITNPTLLGSEKSTMADVINKLYDDKYSISFFDKVGG